MITFHMIVSFSLLVFLTSHYCYSLLSDVAVVCEVNSTQLDKGLIYFRSLWQYNQRRTSDGDLVLGHVCISDTSTELLNTYSPKYGKVGVVVHKLHDVSAYSKYKSLSIEEKSHWRNLLCTSQVADYFFMNNILAVHTLFVSVNFLIIADIRTTLLKRVSLSSLALSRDHSVHCFPKQVNLVQGGDIGGMCEMDIFLISSTIGTEFYGVLNATKKLNLYAHEALSIAARSVAGGISFLQPRSSTGHKGDIIIRDGRMWTGPNKDDNSIALIEMKNLFYHLNTEGCHVNINFEFSNHFNTEKVLTDIFSREMTYLQKFCEDDALFLENFEHITDGLKGTVTKKPSIYDLIIFNDEIELLQLRLEYLRPYVTQHVLIESNTTFTGNPKPLHFLENANDFSNFNIISFTLPSSSTHLGVDDEEVWRREYFTRNQLFSALTHLDVGDEDIILVSDVDEIPHPRALQSLTAIHSHILMPNGNSEPKLIHSPGYRSRIHKFHQKLFMYDFDCYIARKGETLSRTALTATTFGYAKQLFPDNNYSDLMTNVRKYQQGNVPYSYEDILEPGGWHLTFFGGIQRIQSKLTSYSHRNIRRTYVADNENINLDEFSPEIDRFTHLLTEKITSGKQIDDREGEKCTNNHVLDIETTELFKMWYNIMKNVQGVYI